MIPDYTLLYAIIGFAVFTLVSNFISFKFGYKFGKKINTPTVTQNYYNTPTAPIKKVKGFKSYTNKQSNLSDLAPWEEKRYNIT